MTRYNRYYTHGDVEFFLPEYEEPTEEECKDLFNMILLQATRDFFTYQDPVKPTDREIYFTASGLLFDDNYRFYWGDQETDTNYIFDVLGLDKEWIRDGIRQKLIELQRKKQQ